MAYYPGYSQVIPTTTPQVMYYQQPLTYSYIQQQPGVQYVQAPTLQQVNQTPSQRPSVQLQQQQQQQQQNVEQVQTQGANVVVQQLAASQQFQPVKQSFVYQQPITTVSQGPSQIQTQVQYVPQQKAYTDYVEQVYYETVPKYKKIRDYYAIENQTEYVPYNYQESYMQNVPQKSIQYVPQQKVEYVPQTRIEYVPVYTTEYVPQEKVDYVPQQVIVEKTAYQPMKRSFVRKAPELPSEFVGEQRVQPAVQSRSFTYNVGPIGATQQVYYSNVPAYVQQQQQGVVAQAEGEKKE